jgi:hypothetical protein
MDSSKDNRLLFNATSLELLSHESNTDANIIAARTDLGLAQALFEIILLVDSRRSKPSNNNNNNNSNNNNGNKSPPRYQNFKSHKVLDVLLDRLSGLDNSQLQQLLNLTEQQPPSVRVQTNDADTTASATEP